MRAEPKPPLSKVETQENTEKLVFQHIQGRESPVEILSKKKIGQGLVGDIYRAKVRVGGREERIFILKDFGGNRYNAEHAVHRGEGSW